MFLHFLFTSHFLLQHKYDNMILVGWKVAVEALYVYMKDFLVCMWHFWGYSGPEMFPLGKQKLSM